MRKWDKKTFLLQSKPLGEKGTEKHYCLGGIYKLQLCLKKQLMSIPPSLCNLNQSDQTTLVDKMAIFLSPKDNLQNVHTSFSAAIYFIW